MRTEIINDSPQYKEFVRFCNTLRCPLCKCQLDGNISPKLAALYCVTDNTEYKLQWRPGEDAPFWEVINFYYTQYQYEITSILKGGGQFNTTIHRLNMDFHPEQRHKSRKKIFEFTGNRLLFFRRRMEEKVFLKKLKTYTVFS